MQGAGITCVPCSSSFVLPHSRPSLRMKNNFNFCRLRVRAKNEEESNLSTSENTSETVTDPIEPVDPIDPTPVKLTPLPYSFDALEPHMSKETVEHHWDKLQRGHVDRLNDLIKGTEFADMTLMKMVTTSYNKGEPLPFFAHAAQAWNHNFFWHSMSPVEGEKPSGRLSHLINRDFGSFEALSNEIKKAALTQFGSGWVWLAYKANRLGVGNDINPRPSEKDARLVVAKTPNAINPLVWGYFPLLAIDVWEHAYYMDYENRRGDYVSTVLENLVSWEKVGSRLDTLIESIREKTTREHEEMVRRKKMEERIRQRIKELSRKRIASSKKMNVMNTPSRRGRGRGR